MRTPITAGIRNRTVDTEWKRTCFAPSPAALKITEGKFMANAAWLALAVMAHNLGGAVGQLAGGDLQWATAATCAGGCSPSPAGS